ncbi:TonB-dependent receptor [Bacteroides sp.]|uniref:TonB-dependent receptor n=1 Tax=Bacteroides sp. TaxID=29523 RepID=UPI002628AA4C|nr:TonB-dependent receptor [Bacteroides sp.]MDD3038664.1 TonB-dependent receptor plug domain-containing protein [Bacteroides sp.]
MNIPNTIKISIIFLFCCVLSVQGQDNNVVWQLRLDTVTITGKRPFRDIGTTKTVLDTLVLRESITNSLADILSQSTSIFIKSYGRGTMATASFRGTSPSHTQVLWNGMNINSPMLGQVDFSMIPSYFIDDMSLWHGASSVNVTGSGLGGAITLGTSPEKKKGFDLRFIQGISSYHTFDDFLQFRYAGEKWQSSTRVYFVHSKNDFKYINYDKPQINDDGSYNPEYETTRNKNCEYQDFHLLQELYYDRKDGNKFSFTAWLMDSDRGIPMLTTDQREEADYKTRQEETTLRTVGGWDRTAEKLKVSSKLGYTYTHMLYTYDTRIGNEQMSQMQHASSYIYSGFLSGNAEYIPSEKWMIGGNVNGTFNYVDTWEKETRTGYMESRPEISALATVRYRPWSRVGLAIDLREQYYDKFTPLIPAAFLDIALWSRYNVIFKASIARNYRYPTLNDLYFQPGGNPELLPEKGFTYDTGMEFTLKSDDRFTLKGEVTAYDSHIDNWILWLPTAKGFWTPRNVKQVHSYGIELKGKASLRLGEWTLWMDANWSRTKAINNGDPMGTEDVSAGKQLVYIPEYSSAFMGQVSWKNIFLIYKYNYYSKRYTTSSNEMYTNRDELNSYYMNDVSLEKRFRWKQTGVSVKFSVYNLFNEEYVSVLSRPMPRRNYGFTISINPRWGKKDK